MNILVIGSGAREHSIVSKLADQKNTIWAFPGNPGIFQVAQQTTIQKNDFESIAEFCLANNIELVVVGPEQPLAEGITDFLESKEIKVFGPSKLASEIESSKIFAKQLMFEYGIPTARFGVFNKTQFDEAKEYLASFTDKIVVKADGLAAGKGVQICENQDEALKVISEYFEGKFGAASEKIVIEEFIEGEEASIFVVTDGNDYIILPPSQDHKRVYDGDKGKNTGGMGAYAPAPIVTDNLLNKIEQTIIKPTLEALKKVGRIFKGCLYVGVMIDKKNEPYVIEYNCRFGDPEVQAVLELIEGDFAELFLSIASGQINKSTINIKKNLYSSCVVVASGGYPDKFETGFKIEGLENVDLAKVKIYHSGTSLQDNMLVTNGGRVLCFVSSDYTLQASLNKIYSEIAKINFPNMHYRKDIGYRALNLLKENGRT